MTQDSLEQLYQALYGDYSNHHPILHTMTVQLFVRAGMKIFGSVNAGVACYSVFSILFMACAFSFAAETLNEMKFEPWQTALFVLFFAVMPYHIIYSFTMWKDVLFGGFSLYFTVFLFRYIKGLGRKGPGLAGLSVSAFGVCMFRSNGLFAFLITFTVLCVIFKKSFKRARLALLLVIALSLVIKYPLMSALNVRQPDLVESIAIPIQQVSRDIKDNDDFTDYEKDLVNRVSSYDNVAGAYKWYIVDPEKKLIRDRNNQDYLKKNAREYLKFYLTRLSKHPLTYIEAWIDQTKGYYNSGYEYWRWRENVKKNDFGVNQTVLSPVLRNLFGKYSYVYSKLGGLQLFVSTGFAGWLCLIVLITAAFKRDKAAAALTVLPVSNVLTLLIATPVSIEFRYDYIMFCVLPFAAAAVFQNNNSHFEEEKNGQNSSINPVLQRG